MLKLKSHFEKPSEKKSDVDEPPPKELKVEKCDDAEEAAKLETYKEEGVRAVEKLSKDGQLIKLGDLGQYLAQNQISAPKKADGQKISGCGNISTFMKKFPSVFVFHLEDSTKVKLCESA